MSERLQTSGTQTKNPITIETTASIPSAVGDVNTCPPPLPPPPPSPGICAPSAHPGGPYALAMASSADIDGNRVVLDGTESACPGPDGCDFEWTVSGCSARSPHYGAIVELIVGPGGAGVDADVDTAYSYGPFECNVTLRVTSRGCGGASDSKWTTLEIR